MSQQEIPVIPAMTNTERWKSLPSNVLISSATRGAAWEDAQVMVKTVTPLLAGFQEAILCDQGDVPFFLAVGASTEQTRAVLVLPGERDDLPNVEKHLCLNEDAADLAAAFLVDFPNAVFLPPSNSPVCIMSRAGKAYFTLATYTKFKRNGDTKFTLGCN